MKIIQNSFSNNKKPYLVVDSDNTLLNDFDNYNDATQYIIDSKDIEIKRLRNALKNIASSKWELDEGLVGWAMRIKSEAQIALNK